MRHVWVLSVAFLAIACSPTVATPLNTPSPLTQPADAPVAITGKGILKTDAFQLAAGDYVIEWTATATDTMLSGCLHGGELTSPEMPTVHESLGSTGVKTGQTAHGSTNAYALKAGRYYFSMVSGCEWSVAIRPR